MGLESIMLTITPKTLVFVPPQRLELRPDTLEECCTSIIRKGQIKDDEQLYQESRPKTSHTIREQYILSVYPYEHLSVPVVLRFLSSFVPSARFKLTSCGP